MSYAFTDCPQIEELEEFSMMDLTEEIWSSMESDLWEDLPAEIYDTDGTPLIW
jgi:hypothetical protein